MASDWRSVAFGGNLSIRIPNSPTPRSNFRYQLSFYNELTNYGVRKHEIIQVASHLLDNLLAKEKKPSEGVEYYNRIFTLSSVTDEWADRKQLTIQHVTLRSLQLPDV
jgi:hypothetical protein